MANEKYTRFRDIPQFTSWGGYSVDVSWGYLEDWLSHMHGPEGLDLDPDFQRAHVWTETQQTRYVEFILRGGRTGKDILFNAPTWNHKAGGEGPTVLVDGKQRLEAVRRFLRGEIPAFGSLRHEYTDKPDILDHGFKIHVNNLVTRAEVLRWYLDLNSGGVVHTEEELAKVRRLLAAAK